MIARLLRAKGVREFIEAAACIRHRYSEARFRLVGWFDEGPDAVTQDEFAEWNRDGVVDFLGRLDDIRPAMSAARVYVLPSYREGTPRTVLEAMAMGRPVITTDVAGCRETVVDGVNGYLVPEKDVEALVDAMEKIIRQPELAQKMGSMSRRIAEERYDVHKVNAHMMDEMAL
jgi:glycosyltransferase involved in cell wall biosynthesis